jgi:Circularly permutated YpsA SLOG family
MALTKIVSGGQDGVDQAALRAAQALGVACGGWCPPGRKCNSGVIPEVFPLQETPYDRSPDAPATPRSLRTEWNVRDSAATVIFRPSIGTKDDPGTDFTERCAKEIFPSSRGCIRSTSPRNSKEAPLRWPSPQPWIDARYDNGYRIELARL